MSKSRIRTHHFVGHSILIILIFTAAIIASVAYFSSQAHKDISRQYIEHATSKAVEEFRSMTEATETTLKLVTDWGKSGLLNLSDSKAINNLFFPLIDRENVLYGISVADMDGNSYHLSLDSGFLRTSEIKAGTSPRKSIVQIWDQEHERLSRETIATDYDPRNRPWFAPALPGTGVFWTEPYTFYSSGNIGITTSASYQKKKSDAKIVIAFDILLDDLFRKVIKLAPSTNSQIIIFRSDAKLYVPQSPGSGPDFRSFTAIQSQLIQKAHSAWSGRSLETDNVVNINHDNQKWWCGFQPLDAGRADTWMGVMVPEDDITSDINDRRFNILFIGLSSIIGCSGLTFWMVYRYSRSTASPTAIQFDPQDPLGSIQRVIDSGESSSVEFKSTMRKNLHTGKNGKEIEVAWLKGVAAFLNTNSGTLLLGVADDGSIKGLEPDGFENEDKCQLHFKNLIAAHIGAELSTYINFAIVTIENKQIGVVSCKRSPEPAFLKHPKGESFFIRNGPSSDELPVSKVVDYIKNRK